MTHHSLEPSLVDDLVRRALDEDLASGDVTSESVVAPDTRARASFRARQACVVCGGAIVARTFHHVDPDVAVEVRAEEGDRVEAGAELWLVEGRALSILEAERTALNFAQRLSGVATLTRKYVDALSSDKTRICDTRKTTPTLRRLERYAVRAGGGHNHRDNLGAGVLIKDNHIAVAGGVREAIELARKNAPHSCRIEVEVDSLAQLDEALTARADIVLLDNFDDDAVAQAVRRTGGRALLEASGGITLERVAELSRLGVDVISVGALTHSAPAIDIGLDFELVDAAK